MNDNSTIWMGLGIFERLYSDKKIRFYFNHLDSLPNKKVFILADEITGINNFVLSSNKFDRTKDKAVLEKQVEKAHQKFTSKQALIENLISKSVNPDKWQVVYWNYLSNDQGYLKLLNTLTAEIDKYENYYLKREMLKVTIFGFGARLRKNFTSSFVDLVFNKDFYRYLETLANYTLEEVAASLFLAQKDWIKAGHDDEKSYDELSALCFDRFHKILNIKNVPQFRYFEKVSA